MKDVIQVLHKKIIKLSVRQEKFKDIRRMQIAEGNENEIVSVMITHYSGRIAQFEKAIEILTNTK